MSLALFGCRPPVAVSAVTRESAPTLAVAPAPASVPGDLDADGVPDASDRCPDEPEDRDEFEDEDGCVDRDNDGDGILDAFELKDGRWTNCDRREENGVEVDCRNRREDFDGDRDEDGCPDTLCLSQCSEPRLGEPVGLKQTGQLDKGAVKSLDDVAAALMAAPELLIRVEAHVDARSDAEAARRLTRGVAERVIEELVRRGAAGAVSRTRAAEATRTRPPSSAWTASWAKGGRNMQRHTRPSCFSGRPRWRRRPAGRRRRRRDRRIGLRRVRRRVRAPRRGPGSIRSSRGSTASSRRRR